MNPLIPDVTGVFSITDVVLVLLLSFGLGAAMGWVYQATHRGASYTQSFVQTLVLNSMIVAVVMTSLTVNTNAARISIRTPVFSTGRVARRSRTARAVMRELTVR